MYKCCELPAPLLNHSPSSKQKTTKKTTKNKKRKKRKRRFGS